MPGCQCQNFVGNDHRHQRLCTTDTGRRTASVRRSIPAHHHHSQRHECQKPTMGKQHKRRQRKSARRRSQRARIRRPEHRRRDLSDLSRINDAHRRLAGVKSTGDEVQMGNAQQHDGIRPRPIIITIHARPERQHFSAPTWKSAEADWNVFAIASTTRSTQLMSQTTTSTS